MIDNRTTLSLTRSILFLVFLFQIISMSLIADDSQAVVKGSVSAVNGGLANVVVTDGYQCVLTDKQGNFKLTPHKDAAFIYISTPAGYLPQEEKQVPRFYIPIEKNRQRYNFVLKKNPKEDTIQLLLVHADPQFHKPENFQRYAHVVNDMIQLKQAYPDRDILGIDCGDLVGDKPALYPLYIEEQGRAGIPFYRMPGNHDLQFGGRTAETSSSRYEKNFGPDHYSFNRGQVHYVILNNVFYLGRDYFYMGYIDEKSFRWLEQDLAHVPEGTTVILSMHIPGRLDETEKPFQYDSRSISMQTVNFSSLLEMIKPYNVHLLTGHMHYNRNIIHTENFYEHNTGAVSGAWWQGNYCLDGTPVGYGVYEINGSEVTWYFKSVGKDRDHQMRVYAPYSTDAFGEDLVVNIWNWDKNWRIEWFENGVRMGEMNRFEGVDPEVEKAYSNKAGLEFSWIAPVKTDHLFRATPKNRKAEINVVATDPFGRKYTVTIQQQSL